MRTPTHRTLGKAGSLVGKPDAGNRHVRSGQRGRCSGLQSGPRPRQFRASRGRGLRPTSSSATIATPSLTPSRSPPGFLARVDDEGVADAGQRLDGVDIRARHRPAEDGALLEDGVEHAGRDDIDAGRGRPVTILTLSTPGIGWPMILKLFGSLSVTLAKIRRPEWL